MLPPISLTGALAKLTRSQTVYRTGIESRPQPDGYLTESHIRGWCQPTKRHSGRFLRLLFTKAKVNKSKESICR